MIFTSVFSARRIRTFSDGAQREDPDFGPEYDDRQWLDFVDSWRFDTRAIRYRGVVPRPAGRISRVVNPVGVVGDTQPQPRSAVDDGDRMEREDEVA
jgi:hypothetical protein